MFEDKALNNPMVKLSVEGTIELLKDYIASEPLGHAIVRFQKKNPGLSKWDPVSQEYEIWKIICKKAAQKIMEEINKQVGNDLSKLDDRIVDKAINKVLSAANQKIQINDQDALLFAVTGNPIPPNHPLSANKSGQLEKFNLFGENKVIPQNN